MSLNKQIINAVIYELFKNDPLGMPKYKRSYNYIELEEGWEGPQDIPTEQVIIDKWDEMSLKKNLKHPYYYKYQNDQWVLDSEKKQELREAVEGVYDSELATVSQNNFYTECKNIAEQAESEAEFATALYTSLGVESLSTKNKKAALASKSMQELMDIYNNIN